MSLRSGDRIPGHRREKTREDLMYKGDYTMLKMISMLHVCKKHRLPLQVVWDKSEGKYIIQCARGEYPEEIDIWRSGDSV